MLLCIAAQQGSSGTEYSSVWKPTLSVVCCMHGFEAVGSRAVVV